mgnify:CR=1 FL=1
MRRLRIGFALPGLQAQVDAIHALGLPAVVHVCGKTHLLLEALAETGAEVLSLDIVDLAEAKARIGDRVCLMGNVRPTQTLLEAPRRRSSKASSRVSARPVIAPGATFWPAVARCLCIRRSRTCRR